MEAERLLPGGCRVLLLAVGDGDGGVKIDPQLTGGIGSRPGLPRALARNHARWRATTRAGAQPPAPPAPWAGAPHRYGPAAATPSASTRPHRTAPPGRAAPQCRSPRPRRQRWPPPGRRTPAPAYAAGNPGRCPAAPGHCIRQTRLGGQLPQQRRPGVRHHATPVRMESLARSAGQAYGSSPLVKPAAPWLSPGRAPAGSRWQVHSNFTRHTSNRVCMKLGWLQLVPLRRSRPRGAWARTTHRCLPGNALSCRERAWAVHYR